MCVGTVYSPKMPRLVLFDLADLFGINHPSLTEAGWTSLMVASAAGYTDVVRLLLDRNASVDLRTYTGYSALMMASARGQTKAMELLLEKGARFDLQDPFGSSALMVASAKGQLDAVRHLRKCK